LTAAVQYVTNNWLKDYKERFVSCFIDRHRNFGQHTTNRVEGQHAQLKRYITSANTSLSLIVEYVDRLVSLQLVEIRKANESSLTVRYPQHRIPMLDRLLGVVSLKALDLILAEEKRIDKLTDSGYTCDHRLDTICGLPCSCKLQRLRIAGKCI
jgi:histone-lysine N-methyltransferase SETD2